MTLTYEMPSDHAVWRFLRFLVPKLHLETRLSANLHQRGIEQTCQPNKQDIIDIERRVIHAQLTMQTVTVRDLRRRLGEVMRWVAFGDEIAISQRGVIVATLGPPKPATPPTKLDWERRFRERPPVKRKKPLTVPETAEFLHALKRDF